MFQVFVGFIPWIVFWSFSGPGLWTVAVLGAFVAAAVIIAVRYFRKHDVKAMEAVTLAYFALHVCLTVVMGSPFLKTYGPIANSAVLALMAFGTLIAKSSFTYQYAREDWDKAYWNDPAFIRINEIITGVWGVTFTINSALGALAVFVFPQWTILLDVVLPNVLIAVGIVFSSVFPNYSLNKNLKAQLDQWDPYKWPAPKFNGRSANENEHDVIVIGSGVGGLSAAALLAKRGLKVAVFEHHYLPGGFCTSWERRVKRPPSASPQTGGSEGGERWAYTFDAGVHDFSGLHKRGGIRSLLRMLNIEDAIEWKLNEHEYFINEIHLKVPRDADEFACQLGERFPAEAENIKAFFEEMRHVYREMYLDVEQLGGAPRTPDTIEGLKSYPVNHPHVYKWMNRPFVQMLDEFFRDARVKELLSALSGYLSGEPQSLSVDEIAPIFSFYFEGGYYPVGGSQVFADALVNVIEKHGGKIYLRTAVKRVIVENGRAAGVELANGQIHRAKAIVSNADTRKTFLELVGREHIPADFAHDIESLRPSTSAFIVFLGLDIVPEIAPIVVFEDIGIMTPSKTDPSLAPEGHASVSLLKLLPSSEFAQWDRKAEGYSQRKRELADRMIESAEEVIPGLRGHITYRQEGSPATFARYARTTDGSIYGPSTGQKRLTVKSPLRNLYVAGSGVMGGGVEANVISGIYAANEVYPVAK